MTTVIETKQAEPTPFMFTYTLLDAGWASASWEAAGRTLEFSLSYIGDPLRDLLRVLNELNECYDEHGHLIPQADEQNGFDWYGEPQKYAFVFEPLEGRQVRLTITYGCDYGSDAIEKIPEEVWLKTVINLDDLQRQSSFQAEAILKKFGLCGYRLSWIDGDFPITDFLLLRASILHVAIHPQSLAAEVQYLNDLLTDRRWV